MSVVTQPCPQWTKTFLNSAVKLFLMLVLSGSFFISNAQKTTDKMAQQLVAAAGPNSCSPVATTAGKITIDGNPYDWSLTNLNTFPVHSYQLDAFGNGVVDSQFTEGSKDFFEAHDLAWSVSQTKAKNDIANGAAVLSTSYIDLNNVTHNGSFLMFAGDRTSNNGDAQIGFWFYLNGTGPTTVNGQNIFAPDHAVGDLLILADFTGGGRTANVTVYRWVGTGGDVANTGGTLHTTNCSGTVAENN